MEDFKIYNEDCAITLKRMEKTKTKISGVITSPPYNIIRPNSTDRGYDLYNDGMSNEKYSEWMVNIFNNIDKIMMKNGVVIFNMSYGTENTECMSLTIADIIRKTQFTIADIIVWKKQCATPNNVSPNKLTRIVEFIYIFSRKTEILTFNANKKVINTRETKQKIYENKFNFITAKNNDYSTDLNKATYSTELCVQLLDLYFKKNDLIYDPFNGTGTSGNACAELGMKYIGSEISKKQCEHSIKRLKNSYSQLKLF